ncbi:MAG: hypothetical protein IIU14_08230 [Ruminococcus sp.]|nr:hypothetical protein [Ruminococcus sp.]
MRAKSSDGSTSSPIRSIRSISIMLLSLSLKRLASRLLSCGFSVFCAFGFGFSSVAAGVLLCLCIWLARFSASRVIASISAIVSPSVENFENTYLFERGEELDYH